MQSKHWLIIGMLLTGFGLQLKGVETWADVLTPTFVSGTLVALGAGIAALFTDKPEKRG